MSWQQIQINTFTRWINVQLERRGMHINDIGQDLRDGVRLVNLLEEISAKSLGRYNKYPKIPTQQYENTMKCIEFITKEGIKLVNIGNTDITDGNLKITLGLIWTLILRYQIARGGDGDASKAKNELLEWVRSKIPEYDIKGFTKDWNDGRALNGLVNAIGPGICPNHRSLDPTKGKDNNSQGIRLAEEHFNIPPLITGDELANPKVDEQSVMTYISYFRNAVPVKVNYADKCKAYGQGLVDGVANETSEFVVETPPNAGKLEIKVIGPKTNAKVEVKQNNGIYNVSYKPTEPGEWEVHVTLDGNHIPGSVFKVIVLEETSLGGEGKIRVYYSTTSSTEKQRNDKNNLQKMLVEKEIHLRPDFEPWIPVDIMAKTDRDALFKKAGTKALPLVFIDDVYAGDYDRMVELEASGELNKRLKVNEQKFQNMKK